VNFEIYKICRAEGNLTCGKPYLQLGIQYLLHDLNPSIVAKKLYYGAKQNFQRKIGENPTENTSRLPIEESKYLYLSILMRVEIEFGNCL